MKPALALPGQLYRRPKGSRGKGQALGPVEQKAAARAVQYMQKAAACLREAGLVSMTFLETEVPGEADDVRVSMRLRNVPTIR